MFLLSGLEITGIVILCLFIAFILFYVIPNIIIAHFVFTHHLVRKNKDEWKRECSAKDNVEQVQMFDEGLKWAEPFKDKMKEIEITSFDNLHLVGEFFDFGFKKTVIILQGRTESLWYSYYYAKPYPDLGYNVMVVDSRAHGLSEGKYNCVGLKEYKDILKWCELAHDKLNQEKILLHGICIGSATALYTITADNNHDYIEGIITDGMYTTFYETFKTHMINDKRPVFPCLQLVMLIMRIRTGVNAWKNGPIKSIHKLNKPILFIYSKEDKFSLPEKGQYLYDICPSTKKLVWFDHGAHSHVRINNLEKYDNTIKEFVNEHFK